MDLGVSCRLKCFVLCLFYFSGWFNILAEADVCSCQQYNCNTCASTGSCSKINVALSKTARASSLYNSTWYFGVSGPACLAVNGNTGTEFKPINANPDNPACVHTADGDYTPYWEVDLGQQYIISNITVYGRQENGRNMLRKATVSVDDKLCYTFPSDYLQPVKADISCNPPLTGSKVKIQKINDTGLPFLAVCQVQVWVCKSGFYGSDCTNTCGNCSAGTCEPSSGVCPQGCVAGYQAPYCKDTCNIGFYGLNCSKTCGNCFEGNTCNFVSGECPKGCKSGYLGIYCNETCNNGLYGLNCSKSCGNCSEATTCNTESGECPQGCKPGYKGINCNQTCNTGSYGLNCSKTCGNCSELTACNPVSGECPQGSKPGYQLIYCNEICTNHSYGTNCSNTCGNCLTGTACDPISGKCTSGCSAGYQLPLCAEKCRNKTYGENCTAKCGHCDGAVDCNIYSGTCNTCDLHFSPPYCKVCFNGYYGSDCLSTCGYCLNGTCDPWSGVCPHGCIAGFQQPYCQETDAGSYHGNASTAGPVAGAIAGSISGCAIGFVLGMLFMRFRLRKQKDTETSAANFSAHTQTVHSSSPAEKRRTVSADYENATAVYITSNVYDSLKVSRDDAVYTKLTSKGKGAI